MALVQAKCTSCGANLQVDHKLDAANCEHCGAAFVVEKAINNYNIANAQISVQTVNVNAGSSDFIIEGGVLKKYKGNNEEVVIPNTVKIIGAGAFSKCICMSSVLIPNSVTEISGEAFIECVNLRNVTIPDSVKNIEISNNPIGYGRGINSKVFAYCNSLTDVSIPSSIEALAVDTFVGCNNLENLRIDGHLYLIGFFIAPSIRGSFERRDVGPHYGRFDYVKREGLVYGNCKLPDDCNTDDAEKAIGILTFLQRKIGDNRPFYINGVNVIERLMPMAVAHENSINSKSGGACYIATAVYGSYDSPEVHILRRYRDENLVKSTIGRLFIRVYYRLSPPIAQWLIHTRRINNATRLILDKFVTYLSRK